MLDPLYSVRPQCGRHPSWAKNGKTKEGHITAVRNDLPGIAAHTAAGDPKRVQNFIISTGLELRKRIPLARFARSAPRRRSKKAIQIGRASCRERRELLDVDA